jgi:hypothetical protein
MAEPSVTIESPNIQVDAPVSVGLKGITEDISNRFRELVDAVKSGDDEVMAALFLGVAFVVAGVFVWRRL